MKRKINTMKSTQEPTDEEIQRYMDFDKLLLEKNQFVAQQKRKTYRIISSAGLLLITVAAITFFVLKEKPENDVTKVTNLPIDPTADNELPVSIPEDEDKLNTPEPSGQGTVSEQKEKPAKKQKADLNSVDEQEKSKQKYPNELPAVYQQPEPVNGYPDLYAYFDKELTYPQSAIKDSVQGVVTVVFYVNLQGKADDIRIENSLGQAFDEEVFRVIRNMPAWRPAYYNGKVVKSKVSLPLTFSLKKVSSLN
jgi:TonB family protein